MTETTTIGAAASAYRQAPLTVEGIRSATGSRAQAREVARHFEALLIQEVVKAARSAGGSGWLGEDAGETSESTAQMGEEFLATAIAAGGGFGLAAVFSRSLEAALTPASISETPLPQATLEKISEKP